MEKSQVHTELSNLALTGKPSWSSISTILQGVEDSGYWKDEASSFTEWVLTKTAFIGLKQASLWRYLSAGRIYLKFSQSPSRKGINTPELWDLPETVSPENLELLSKLSRILPEAEIQNLFEDVLGGKIRRAQLRSMWEDFRPTLRGKTARGRNVSPPNLDLMEGRDSEAFFDAIALDALRSTPPYWTGIGEPEKYAVFSNIGTEGNNLRLNTKFDAAVLVKPRDAQIIYHGIAIMSANPVGHNIEIFLHKFNSVDFSLFDYCWVIVPTFSNKKFFSTYSNHVGILTIDKENRSIIVHRHPEKAVYPNNGDMRLDLASALLLRTM